MRVDAFDFDLPRELVAQHPVRPRDAARLLVVRTDRLEDRRVADLPALLRPGDLLVFNDTRVLPARLVGRRGAATVEVTLLEPAGGTPPQCRDDEEARAAYLEPRGAALWRAFARPARRCRPGDRVDFGDGFAAEVVGRGEGGAVTLAFGEAGEVLIARLRRHGAMPLPPYIKRPEGGDPRDVEDYQTMFARRDGAIAAPTAALHFTPGLMAALDAHGVRHAFVTLHVGAGTFLPVKVDDTADHRMHIERFDVPAAAADAVATTRERGGRIVAVGTTVLRTLETVARPDGTVGTGAGATDLFITPGHRFRVADLLLTNFHLPRSTLFMLVSAFAGQERMRAAYAHAIARRYRFYSYGDACLLERAS